MPTPHLTLLPARTRPRAASYLLVFFQPTGSRTAPWSSFAPHLDAEASELGAQVLCAGTGGAPYFQRWLLLAAPSDPVRERVAALARLWGDLRIGRPPMLDPRTECPVLAVRVSADECTRITDDAHQTRSTLAQLVARAFCLGGHVRV